MSVSPFYAAVNIEGRETTMKGGPRSKDGNMSITFTQRHNGSIVKAFETFSRRMTHGDNPNALVTDITVRRDSVVRLPNGEYIELPAGSEISVGTEY